MRAQPRGIAMNRMALVRMLMTPNRACPEGSLKMTMFEMMSPLRMRMTAPTDVMTIPAWRVCFGVR